MESGGDSGLLPSNSSYWLDACEDVSDLVDFDAPHAGNALEQQPVDDPGFFLEMDRFLETIKNVTSSSPPASEIASGKNARENGGFDGEIRQVLEIPECEDFEEKMSEFGSESKKRKESSDQRIEAACSEKSGCKRSCTPKIPGLEGRREGRREEREERRAPRKRGREVEERERRERDRDRREREREKRGFWERDRLGRVVFRYGSWEAEANREAKRAKQDSQDRVRSPEKKLDEKKEKPVEEQARKYQLDVLEQARQKNTIAFLETGAGKTLIAVLLIKSICREMEQQNRKILAIFLVPKVPLVYQQAEVIRERTGYRVGHYCGEMGQDFWDTRRWQREFESKQVLVMTAQILLNILRHSIIKMEAIHLLILDECHHAVKKHPYSLVMSEFYHTTPKDKRPAVFGMTASPVNLKAKRIVQ